MRLKTFCAGSIAWIITSTLAWAQSPKPVDVLPSTTIVYVEGIHTQSVLDLPLIKSVTSTPLFAQLWKSPDAMKLRGGITLVELALGERLPETLGKLTSNGWSLAIDSHSQGVVLWTRSQDAATCNELYNKLLSIAQSDAKSKGHELKQVTYKDVDAYEVGGAIIGRLDDTLIVANKSELVKKLVDRWRDRPAKLDSLAANPRFQEFAKQLSNQALSQPTTDKQMEVARVWVDLKQVREAGLANKLFKGPSDNFAAELLLGGVIELLRDASTVQATLSSHDKHLQVRIEMPISKSAISDKYEYFFGKDASGQAPALIKLSGMQANISVYRDIAQLWQRAGDLFGQSTNDQLAQAETTLTTLFSGRDFANDILGSIRPELQLIVTEQDFAKAKTVPQIKLPAFALVTRLRDPQAMQPQMKRIFMSLIGFVNVAGAMNQQPQLDLEAFRLESGWEVTATYAVDADRPKDWIVPIQYNFSPTLFMTGEHAVIASTKELARAIGEQLQQPVASTKELVNQPNLNSMLKVDGELLSRALGANRQQLISQNMVEKGHTQEEAAAEVDFVLQAATLVKSMSIALGVGDKAVLDLQVQLTDN